MRSAPASLSPLSFATAPGRRVRTNFPSGLKHSSHEFRFYRWRGLRTISTVKSASHWSGREP